MQKSQITFAPVSFYPLRKQKRPIDRTNDEPPPILTKGSETEFDSEEPPPPLLEAEQGSDGLKNDSDRPNQTGSVSSGSTAKVDRATNGDPETSTESFFLESRHLPSWLRHCPKCPSGMNSEVLFRGRIAGSAQSGPIVSFECALCSTSIYNSCLRWKWPLSTDETIENQFTKEVDCLTDQLKPSTSAVPNGKEISAGKILHMRPTAGEVGFNQNSHQFGLSFPVMFETQNGQQNGHCERITFRGFLYCHISRQVRTRGGKDSVSYWRCQQRIGPLSANCSGLVRLEGKCLTFVKGHKHPPDYAATRAILAHVCGEFTRLTLVSNRKDRTRNCIAGTPMLSSASAPIILRPIANKDALNRITSRTERTARRGHNSTEEPTAMETDELIRAITSRKELLTVKVSPST